MDTNVVEQCEISPSHGGAAEQSLRILLSISTCYGFPSLPCKPSISTTPHFINTIVPSLKNSLSLTLKHFLPLAGKIIFPLNSGTPVSHYAAGEDSVSLTIAISDSDFFSLTGNHLRDADDFHDFVPEMPPAVYSSDFIKFPVIALQVTLFPDKGICIGVTNHHVVADGATMVCFLQTWASINKFNDDLHLLALGKKVLPAYDRTHVQDSCKLTTLVWEMMKNSRPAVCSNISFPMHKLRGTFVLSDAEVLKLNNFVTFKKPCMQARVSYYTIVCVRVWSCLVYSAACAGEKVSDDEQEYLSMPADCRARLTPALPDTYFGNCLILVLAECAHGRLKGSDGFVAAVEAIGEAIHKTLDNEKGILNGCGEQYMKFTRLDKKRVVGVTGSPRFDLCGVDYGWGGLKKLEALHIDISGSVSLCKTRDRVEVGVSLSKSKMDAFASIFNKKTCDAETEPGGWLAVATAPLKFLKKIITIYVFKLF